MSDTGSALYRGRVRHTRLRPLKHDFEYRVFYALLDIDELDALDRQSLLFSVRRLNLFGFDPKDHGPCDGSSLRNWAEMLATEAGVDIGGGTVRILALPRILGYVFNPISIWYCTDAEGALRVVFHEVRNTFGDRHVYVVPVNGDLQHTFGKELHVSPFNGMDHQYRFTISEPGQRLHVAIEESDEDGVLLRAGLRLSKLPFEDRQLLRLFATHPLLTLKVIAGIHWQALKIWLKGGKYHRRPSPASHKVTVVQRQSVAS